MFLQTFATLTTAITLAATTFPAGGAASAEAPTFGNEPNVTFDSVVQNFSQANQLLLAVEDAAQQVEPDRDARIEPVIALLEEQLNEAASQLTFAEQIEHQAVARASVRHTARVSPEVYEGINSDITSVTNDLKRLASAISTDEYL